MVCRMLRIKFKFWCGSLLNGVQQCGLGEDSICWRLSRSHNSEMKVTCVMQLDSRSFLGETIGVQGSLV